MASIDVEIHFALNGIRGREVMRIPEADSPYLYYPYPKGAVIVIIAQYAWVKFLGWLTISDYGALQVMSSYMIVHPSPDTRYRCSWAMRDGELMLDTKEE